MQTSHNEEIVFMFSTNNFAAKLFAGLGAIAMTVTLMASSFANPNAASVAGLLA
ncbi:hypothetical protein CP97_14798 [Aurantiacibacter atlanticus]|uniref:Uncharacterized protein n=1 Tax=Aurantiacibacter atlanticus TaxID=1648404 RepID=A0A161IGG5_9SPHN|nr:hypothetical protein CP97_14798 [Aurantiacibacter atlanticus]